MLKFSEKARSEIIPFFVIKKSGIFRMDLDCRASTHFSRILQILLCLKGLPSDNSKSLKKTRYIAQAVVKQAEPSLAVRCDCLPKASKRRNSSPKTNHLQSNWFRFFATVGETTTWTLKVCLKHRNKYLFVYSIGPCTIFSGTLEEHNNYAPPQTAAVSNGICWGRVDEHPQEEVN